jgi:hypothetical protein
VTVTEAATASLVLSVTPSSLPAAGGSLDFSVAAVGVADGTTVYLWQSTDGGNTFQDTGVSAVLSGAAASLAYTVPANTGTAAVTLQYYVSTQQ